ncbi:hypothetical protein F4811DRAFT_75921 [Daldinia bambusicola]|nr:hypothetical protein F4811DRAFT_75921 [Daldinia bambusicola]
MKPATAALLDILKEVGPEATIRVQYAISYWGWENVKTKEDAEAKIESVKCDVMNTIKHLLDQKAERIRDAVFASLGIDPSVKEEKERVIVKTEEASAVPKQDTSPASDSDSDSDVVFVGENEIAPPTRKRPAESQGSGLRGRPRKSKLTHTFALSTMPQSITNKIFTIFQCPVVPLAQKRTTRNTKTRNRPPPPLPRDRLVDARQPVPRRPRTTTWPAILRSAGSSKGNTTGYQGFTSVYMRIWRSEGLQHTCEKVMKWWS